MKKERPGFALSSALRVSRGNPTDMAAEMSEDELC